MVLYTLSKSSSSYRLTRGELTLHKKQLLRIIAIGLPAGIQSLMYSLSNVFIQTAINEFGTDAVAAWAAYSKIDSVYWMISSSFGIGVTTFVGQNYGAGLYKRVRQCIRQSAVIMALITVFMTFILYKWGFLAFNLFATDESVINTGTAMIRYLSPFYITYTTIELLSGSLRGMGNSLKPMIISVFGICILRVLWIFFAVPVWHRIETVEFSYPLTWVTTSILFLLYYFRFVNKRKIF
jgi:Na+-driven multidrug efflux pump